jgi:purine-nucleoside phosphorylase
MNEERVRVFVNERAVEVARGATVSEAVNALDPELAGLLATSAARLTDATGRPVTPSAPVGEAGGVFRVVVTGRTRRTGTGSVDAAAEAVVRRLGGLRPRVAIVAGSGLGLLADRVREAQRIRYAEIPGFPEPGVAGHKAELVAGTLASVPVVVQAGRFHFYEGHPPETVTLPVRVFDRLGVRTLIVTNAAGGIRRTFRPGALMLIADHINLMGRNPLAGPVVRGEDRFPDMSAPYDPALAALAHDAARAAQIPLEAGVYAGVLGPSYETPAEIRMMERLGADAVGMSTVPEVLVARARGLRVLGFSVITNLAAGLGVEPLSHADVLERGARTAAQLAELIESVIPRP